MNSSNRSSPPASPSQAERLLSKFSDTESLFVRSRPTGSENGAKAPPIPLIRFQELEQAIRHSPANADPYAELGQIYLQQERWLDARRVLDAGVQNCPESETIVLMREDLMLLLANQHVEHAKLLHLQQPNEQTKYGLEQAEVSMANERIRVCRDRYSRRPEEREILITWAIALRQLARHEDAIELLTRASEVPTLRARASLQLGMCLQTLGRPLEALAAFRKAALYRAPEPDRQIKVRALELAMSVAEENRLIDSSRVYAKELLACCDASKKSDVEEKLAALERAEL